MGSGVFPADLQEKLHFSLQLQFRKMGWVGKRRFVQQRVLSCCQTHLLLTCVVSSRRLNAFLEDTDRC
jgi:hypothetical protein